MAWGGSSGKNRAASTTATRRTALLHEPDGFLIVSQRRFFVALQGKNLGQALVRGREIGFDVQRLIERSRGFHVTFLSGIDAAEIETRLRPCGI